MTRQSTTEVTAERCYCSDLQGVLCRVCSAANLDQWATARSGRARIRLCFRGHDFQPNTYEVYALDGHELLPRTKSFPHTPEGLAAARAYANDLWRTL